MKYRKKPVEVEAMVWTGDNASEIQRFAGKAATITTTVSSCRWNDVDLTLAPPSKNLTIHTLEGDMKASVGDFIIRGVDGEFYPCKPEIFKQTYERIEPEMHIVASGVDFGRVGEITDITDDNEHKNLLYVGDIVVCSYDLSITGGATHKECLTVIVRDPADGFCYPLGFRSFYGSSGAKYFSNLSIGLVIKWDQMNEGFMIDGAEYKQM